jgi:hypothetical protein
MNTNNDKKRIIPFPSDGAYANSEESGDFRKIEVDDDMDDDIDDVNFMDMPAKAPADGDENYQDEEEKRSRKDYRDDSMIEETRD